MTVLLLDTHALAWSLTTPDRLSEAARAAVADPGNDLLVSSATAWELAIKYQSGKWPEAEPLVRQYGAVLSELGARELPITGAHALRAGGLGWSHRDPFDRMLAAQALMENLSLVSRDPAFDDLAGLVLLW